MATKYICLKECFQKDGQGNWKLFSPGETDWREVDPGKHWSKIGPEPKNATEVWADKCASVGIVVDPKWEIDRLAREYEHRLRQMHDENSKKAMAGTVPQSDGRVFVKDEPAQKRK